MQDASINGHIHKDAHVVELLSVCDNVFHPINASKSVSLLCTNMVDSKSN